MAAWLRFKSMRTNMAAAITMIPVMAVQRRPLLYAAFALRAAQARAWRLTRTQQFESGLVIYECW